MRKRDISKCDGSLRNLMDVGRLAAMGRQASIGFEEGVSATFCWYLEHQGSFRR